MTSPQVVITNPSEHHSPPNGPEPEDPLTNQFSYFNVPGWFDDTCGGSIDATVKLGNGQTFSTLKTRMTPVPGGTLLAVDGLWWGRPNTRPG